MDDFIDPSSLGSTTGSRSASRCRARKTRCCCAARASIPTTGTCRARPIAGSCAAPTRMGLSAGSTPQAAQAMPGVLAVYTAADLAAGGIGPLPARQVMNNRDGTPMLTPVRHALATDKVRHVGEAVAAVIAETLAAAKDGAEAVELDIDPLPAVTEPRRGRRARRAAALRRRAGQCRAGFPFRRQRGGRRRLCAAPRMSRGSCCATTASSSTRWSRAPRWPNTTRSAALDAPCRQPGRVRVPQLHRRRARGRARQDARPDRPGRRLVRHEAAEHVGVFLHPARGARTRPPGQMDRRPLRQLCLRHARPRRTR